MKRVLLVEDNDLFREMLALVLGRHAGLEESVQAGSFAEARRALEEPGGPVDLAVVDLDLPDGDGVALISELHGSWSDLPVLALTKNHDPELQDRALKAGANQVLTTTASGEEIIGAARRLGGPR